MKHKVKEGGKNEQGFTLIEVAMGIAIFAIAVVGIMMTLGHSLTMSTFANNRATAMNKTQYVIEEVRWLADTTGLVIMVTTARNRNWNTWVAQNWVVQDPNYVALESENINVTDLNGNNLVNNADPLPVRVSISWSEKGKNTNYAVDTMVTQR